MSHKRAQCGHSPCLCCPRRHLDKNKCSSLCKRRLAFVTGEDWTNFPIPMIRLAEDGAL